MFDRSSWLLNHLASGHRRLGRSAVNWFCRAARTATTNTVALVLYSMATASHRRYRRENLPLPHMVREKKKHRRDSAQQQGRCVWYVRHSVGGGCFGVPILLWPTVAAFIGRNCVNGIRSGVEDFAVLLTRVSRASLPTPLPGWPGGVSAVSGTLSGRCPCSAPAETSLSRARTNPGATSGLPSPRDWTPSTTDGALVGKDSLCLRIWTASESYH